MQGSGYYLDQAHLLFEWAKKSTDPALSRGLETRAQRYLFLAAEAELDEPPEDHRVSAIELFNGQQLGFKQAPVAQQQQQIQPENNQDD